MNIPEIFVAAAGVPILSGGLLATWVVILTALTAVAPRAWFLALLLGGQFVGYGLLLAGLRPPYHALAVWITGFFTATVLATTAVQIRQRTGTLPLYFPTGRDAVWRIGAALAVPFIAWLLSRLPALTIGGSASLSWVVLSCGLLALFLFARPLPPLLLGVAFIEGISAIGLWQAAGSSSRIWLGFWLVSVLLAALTTAALTLRTQDGGMARPAARELPG